MCRTSCQSSERKFSGMGTDDDEGAGAGTAQGVLSLPTGAANRTGRSSWQRGVLGQSR